MDSLWNIGSEVVSKYFCFFVIWGCHIVFHNCTVGDEKLCWDTACDSQMIMSLVIRPTPCLTTIRQLTSPRSHLWQIRCRTYSHLETTDCVCDDVHPWFSMCIDDITNLCQLDSTIELRHGFNSLPLFTEYDATFCRADVSELRLRARSIRIPPADSVASIEILSSSAVLHRVTVTYSYTCLKADGSPCIFTGSDVKRLALHKFERMLLMCVRDVIVPSLIMSVIVTTWKLLTRVSDLSHSLIFVTMVSSHTANAKNVLASARVPSSWGSHECLDTRWWSGSCLWSSTDRGVSWHINWAAHSFRSRVGQKSNSRTVSRFAKCESRLFQRIWSRKTRISRSSRLTLLGRMLKQPRILSRSLEASAHGWAWRGGAHRRGRAVHFASSKNVHRSRSTLCQYIPRIHL